MTIRKLVIGAALLVVGLPVAFVLAVFVSVTILNQTSGSIVSSGQRRDYLLYVPQSYDPGRPSPLVISLHGAMTWPAFQMHLSRWNEAADVNGFLVVYPAGTGLGPKAWFMEGEDSPPRMPDILFISELIDTLAAAYNIDPARIYANGFSNGGGMAFALSCTLPRRIAAIGMVAAAQSLSWSWCPDSAPMPMIAFHGTADPLVPYTGAPAGWLNPRPFPNILTWTEQWARRNRCEARPMDSTIAPDVTRRDYFGCADDAPVVLYTIRGGGHTWPGGKPLPAWLLGRTTNDIEATSLMWAFFRDHPRHR